MSTEMILLIIAITLYAIVSFIDKKQKRKMQDEKHIKERIEKL